MYSLVKAYVSALLEFLDLQNMTPKLKAHETSPKHTKSVMTLYGHSVVIGLVDEQLHQNMFEQTNYCKNVLSRYVETIIFLYERGLAIRGSNEIDKGQLFGHLRAYWAD